MYFTRCSTVGARAASLPLRTIGGGANLSWESLVATGLPYLNTTSRVRRRVDVLLQQRLRLTFKIVIK